MYQRLRPMPHSECQRELCAVPPSPGLMNSLLQRWIDLMAEKRLPPNTTFKQWFDYWVSSRRGQSLFGWTMAAWTMHPAPARR